MDCRIFSCAKEPELEAFEAASSPFRLVFKAFDIFQPVFMIVVGIDDFQTEGFGIAGALPLADLIFLARIDVGIAVVYDRSDSMIHQTLDDGA